MEGEDKLSSNSSEMNVNEIYHIVKIATGLGVSKVKLTGGEPLIRKDILEIVKTIAAIRGLTDLSMTTNGTMLASLAKNLYDNGLKRVNISLPTLNAELYHKLTGGALNDALEGVEAAVAAGFNPVKLNMLILKCASNYDFIEMLHFARETGTILQLIELEPINVDGTYYSTNHKALVEYETLLKQKALKTEVRTHMQNRLVYHLPDVKVEVIHFSENTEFCAHCTRLRVTSDGKLKPCLMRNDNLVDILTSMRNGANDKMLTELFTSANQNREPYDKRLFEAPATT